MSNWQQKVYNPAIKPLVELLKKHILAHDFMQMDETTMRVMNEPEKANTSTSYAWAARGGPPDKPAVIFTYRNNRSHQHPKEFLEQYSGYVQIDGYAAYETTTKSRPDIKLVGCFAHVRRKYHDAWIASKKKSKRAETGIQYVKKLCKIEKELRGQNLSAPEFLKKRKEAATPVLEQFKLWCEEELPKTPPDSNLGKAFSYTLHQWDKLARYVEHPEITPTNNLVENIIRPFVLGRKNWLHNGSPEGAEASCGLFSIIQTAKLNSLNVYVYLNYLFTEIPKRQPESDLSDLIPFNIDTKKLKTFMVNQIPNLVD